MNFVEQVIGNIKMCTQKLACARALVAWLDISCEIICFRHWPIDLKVSLHWDIMPLSGRLFMFNLTSSHVSPNDHPHYESGNSLSYIFRSSLCLLSISSEFCEWSKCERLRLQFTVVVAPLQRTCFAVYNARIHRNLRVWGASCPCRRGSCAAP